MKGTLPTKADIRNRFLFMYGFYVIIVILLWIFIDVQFIYVVPLLAVLSMVGYVNYRMNVRILSKRPLMSSDDFHEFTGIAMTEISDDGHVKIRGEIWKAKSREPIMPGSKVRVVDLIDKMTLLVEED